MSDTKKTEVLLGKLHKIIIDTKTNTGIFGNKSFDKEQLLSLIEDIKYSLPNELKEARKILDNADKIMQDANIDAKKLIKSAEEQAEMLLSEHNITRLAKEEEEIKRKEVKEFVMHMRDGALNYADNCLSDVEEVLNASIEQISYITKTLEDKLSEELERIYENRQEIRSGELYDGENNREFDEEDNY